MDLLLELVVDEVITKQVSVDDHVIVHISLYELHWSAVGLGGVGLTQQPMRSELSEGHLRSHHLIDELIGVGEDKVEVLRRDGHRVRGGEVEGEEAERKDIAHSEFFAVDFDGGEALISRAGTDEGGVDLPIRHLLEGHLPHVGAGVRPAVGVRLSIDDGALSLSEEHEARVDLQVFFSLMMLYTAPSMPCTW